jgi:ribosome-associated protein
VAPPAKRTPKPAAPEPVEVRLPITLGQFLKVAQLVSSGGEAKILIADGEVLVNGQVDTRRGRKLKPGDVVQAHRASARVTAGEAAEVVAESAALPQAAGGPDPAGADPSGPAT